MSHPWHCAIDIGQIVCAIYLDLKRAFDTVAIFIYFFVNYGRLDALKRPYVGLSRIYVIDYKKLISLLFRYTFYFCRGTSGVNIRPSPFFFFYNGQ